MTRRWTEVLCQGCGGNGVIKIAGGVSECPRCGGRCFEPDDLPQTLPSPKAVLRGLVQDTGSQKKAARLLGITPQHVNDILHGRREISERVASALGYQRVVTYIEKPGGIVNSRLDRSRDHEFVEGADGTCYACGRSSIDLIHVLAQKGEP
jgi:Helix-turn-helix